MPWRAIASLNILHTVYLLCYVASSLTGVKTLKLFPLCILHKYIQIIALWRQETVIAQHAAPRQGYEIQHFVYARRVVFLIICYVSSLLKRDYRLFGWFYVCGGVYLIFFVCVAYHHLHSVYVHTYLHIHFCFRKYWIIWFNSCGKYKNNVYHWLIFSYYSPYRCCV